MKTKIKTIVSLITDISNYQIEVANSYDFYSYITKYSIQSKGFGQDKHSAEYNPTYAVYKLDETIEYNGYLYDTISIDYNSGATILQPSFEDAIYNASEVDGRGTGYLI